MARRRESIGVVYGIGRLDASGRVADRTITHALGWSPGDRLILTADAESIQVRRGDDGLVRLTARALITLPASARDRIGVRPGDQVLLAANPRRGPTGRVSVVRPAWRDDLLASRG